ncbi:zinc finger, PHD-type [Artemisia annua]|uniref:Zinc finger, PHD-type n=1 Tax=Artemisia annua TaxID=35608 RepID=A0A2U1LB62_ARTAN|nr:zinc finger, PHD-type [Artemisia annua]
MESQPKLQNPENIITLIQHEHPLQLVDLQPCYPDYTEYSDDEEEDRVIKWDFNSPCNQCGKVINVYHRICREPFGLEYLWIYKCESCRYFVHLDCATTSRSADIGKTIKNFEDADHPNLLNLPFPDHTYSILQHWVSQESGSTTAETSERNLKHICHEHVLSLVGTQSNDSKGASSSSASSLSCHNPMKRIELLCNGCVRPIMDVPFYKCSSDDQRCDFVLHEWCTRLPELRNYPGHTHTLRFLPKVSENIFGIFKCQICELSCNGFAYGCTKCQYYIDVNCGFIPDEITHEAHPDHILSRCDRRSMRKRCVAEGTYVYGSKICFSCESCHDFYLHSDCALFLPRIINHKLDKHPMKLTYGPVENHKSEYFCEVCEEELDPTKWFYHCNVCAYSLHTRCAPVILNFQAAYNNYGSLYAFLNIKFGGMYNIKGHEHSVSLALGSDADGKCPICPYDVIKDIIIKCQKCKLAMHYKCCRD